MVIKDFTSVMGLLPQYALPGAKWYMSQQGFYSIGANLFAEAGGNRSTSSPREEKHRILGFPVVDRAEAADRDAGLRQADVLLRRPVEGGR
jgi:hypothetical protein